MNFFCCDKKKVPLKRVSLFWNGDKCTKADQMTLLALCLTMSFSIVSRRSLFWFGYSSWTNFFLKIASVCACVNLNQVTNCSVWKNDNNGERHKWHRPKWSKQKVPNCVSTSEKESIFGQMKNGLFVLKRSTSVWTTQRKRNCLLC